MTQHVPSACTMSFIPLLDHPNRLPLPWPLTTVPGEMKRLCLDTCPEPLRRNTCMHLAFYGRVKENSRSPSLNLLPNQVTGVRAQPILSLSCVPFPSRFALVQVSVDFAIGGKNQWNTSAPRQLSPFSLLVSPALPPPNNS